MFSCERSHLFIGTCAGTHCRTRLNLSHVYGGLIPNESPVWKLDRIGLLFPQDPSGTSLKWILTDAKLDQFFVVVVFWRSSFWIYLGPFYYHVNTWPGFNPCNRSHSGLVELWTILVQCKHSLRSFPKFTTLPYISKTVFYEWVD